MAARWQEALTPGARRAPAPSPPRAPPAAPWEGRGGCSRPRTCARRSRRRPQAGCWPSDDRPWPGGSPAGAAPSLTELSPTRGRHSRSGGAAAEGVPGPPRPAARRDPRGPSRHAEGVAARPSGAELGSRRRGVTGPGGSAPRLGPSSTACRRWLRSSRNSGCGQTPRPSATPLSPRRSPEPGAIGPKSRSAAAGCGTGLPALLGPARPGRGPQAAPPLGCPRPGSRERRRPALPLPSSAPSTRLSAPHSGATGRGAAPSERILRPAAQAARRPPGAQRRPAAPAGCPMPRGAPRQRVGRRGASRVAAPRPLLAAAAPDPAAARALAGTTFLQPPLQLRSPRPRARPAGPAPRRPRPRPRPGPRRRGRGSRPAGGAGAREARRGGPAAPHLQPPAFAPCGSRPGECARVAKMELDLPPPPFRGSPRPGGGRHSPLRNFRSPPDFFRLASWGQLELKVPCS